MQAHRWNPHKNLWIALLAAWPLLGQAGVIPNPNALLAGSGASASPAQGTTPTGGFAPTQGVPASGSAPTWQPAGGQNATSSGTSTSSAAPATPASTNPLMVRGTVTTPAQHGGADGVEYVNTGHGQVMALPPLPTVVKQGVQANGRYGWIVQMPVRLVFEGDGERSANDWIMVIHLQRRSNLTNPYGIAIQHFHMLSAA